jgi:Fe2+ or Zn2+ uptake regulation protein
MSGHRKKKELSKKILNYLQKHPDAGDTVEGIARWWLESERVYLSVDAVGEALESLQEKGLLRRVNDNGDFVYRLNE